MDPRSATGLTADPDGALERFLAAHGCTAEHLVAARRRTAQRLAALREQAASITLVPDVSIVLFGSSARAELTEHSDDDWAVLVAGNGADDAGVERSVEAAGSMLGGGARSPGSQGIFGAAITCPEMVDRIGLDEDSNTNLTRRALLLLESVEVAGSSHARCRRELLERYLERGVKDYRPPRFLLNDIIRYWRTIGVDFEGKHRELGGDDPKWVTRNAKLRTSRKVLFAGGLIAVLGCHLLAAESMLAHLEHQLAATPLDRLALAFEGYGAIDEAVRFLSAYDRWIGIMGDESAREELGRLRYATRDRSTLFAEIREIGEILDGALIALLFDTRLSQVARRYAVL